jgi:tRNA threonylcarbamoyladenosine biosynthesis protein TsaB
LAGKRRLLALDSAGSACSAAVWAEGAVLARRFEVMRRGQSERLVPMIQEAMSEAGLVFTALDAIAVTLGPGGFTGVRIGLATARGLALACGRPVLGLSSFMTVAAAVPEAERKGRRLAVLLDAKRSDFYLQVFDPNLAPLAEPACVAPVDLAAHLPTGRLVLAGDAVAQGLTGLGEDWDERFLISDAPGHADAAILAELAADLPLPEPDVPLPRPLYLRPPDVTLPDGQRRQ